MKVRMSGGPEYDSKYDWNCFCQGGTSGIVLPKGSFDKIFSDEPLKGLAEGMSSEESYTTAFFEAFPKNPSCFLRGEGATIEEAEESCWKKYQKVLNCNHEMERRDRTDGYAYCKHCSYSSTVFEPLTKCCKCGKPTSYSKDYKGKYYCKKHAQTKPKNPNPSRWEITDNRLSRKRKKLLKKSAEYAFQKSEIFGKVKFTYKLFIKFTCNNKEISLLFGKQEKQLIEKYKNKKYEKRSSF
jgi:hypothetical protein